MKLPASGTKSAPSTSTVRFSLYPWCSADCFFQFKHCCARITFPETRAEDCVTSNTLLISLSISQPSPGGSYLGMYGLANVFALNLLLLYSPANKGTVVRWEKLKFTGRRRDYLSAIFGGVIETSTSIRMNNKERLENSSFVMAVVFCQILKPVLLSRSSSGNCYWADLAAVSVRAAANSCSLE